MAKKLNNFNESFCLLLKSKKYDFFKMQIQDLIKKKKKEKKEL